MPSSQFFDLMDALSSLDVDKFQSFEVITTQYKPLKQDNGGISTDILLPKGLLENQRQQRQQQATCPILVRIHGGFLVTGSSRYAPWFSNWILDYATNNEAVIVSPNYRLLPEASGQDVLQDMDDFWNWLHTGGLAQSLKGTGHGYIIPDLERILMLGESAGGYLAVQLAFTNPSKVRGVVAAYPMLDLKSPFYTTAYSKPIVGVPNLSHNLVEEHLSTGHTVITEADPPNRLELAFSIVQNGRLLDYLGDNPYLFPMERIENLSSASGSLDLPPFFIFHGENDSAVPAEGSRKFVSLLRHRFPDARVRLYIQDGDHGFDANATLETPWLEEGLGLISSNWLTSTPGLSHL